MGRNVVAAAVAIVVIACAGVWGFAGLSAEVLALPASPKAHVQPHAAPLAAPAENAVPEGRVEVLRLLFSRDFPALTRLLEQRQEAVEQDIRNEGAFGRVLAAFDTADPAVTPLIDGWIEVAPKSFAPRLARAQHRVAIAWARRGRQYAKDTTDAQVRGMAESLAGAVADAQAALAQNSRLVDAYRLIIRSAMGLGRNDACVQVAERGTAAMPASMRIRVALTHCLLPRWGGSHVLMQAIARESGKHAADNPALAALHGYVDWDLGNLEDDHAIALEHYARALASGEYFLFYSDRADAYLGLRRYESALADANRGLALEPDHPALLVQRARAYAGLGRLRDAREDLDLVALIDPTHPDLGGLRERELARAVHEGYTLATAGDYPAAIARLTSAIELVGGTAEAYYRRGRAYLLSEQHDRALVDFERAVAIDPRHFESYRNLDFIFAKRGQWDDVIRRWTAYLELEPKSGPAYFERGGAHNHKGDRTAALADARKACDLGTQEACAIVSKFAAQ